jgi:hypothetical protein
MVMLNYGDVLVSVMMLCITRESLVLIGEVLMMCIYLTSRSPCMHTRFEYRKKGDELVMKKSSNISLAIW